MDARSRFHEHVKQILTPALRAEGFHVSGTTYRRSIGEVLHVVNLQGSTKGGQCCVNLGIHLTFLPAAGSSAVKETKTIEEMDCAFRRRLTPAGQSDAWWAYGECDSEASEAVRSILNLHQSVGAPYFRNFSRFPEDFGKVTPEMLTGNVELPFPPAGTFVGQTLSLSRIAMRIGRPTDARVFAEIGLARIGPAVGLMKAFKSIIEAANQKIGASGDLVQSSESPQV